MMAWGHLKFTVTVTRTGALNLPTTVDVIAGGSATEGEDYTISPTTVNFAAGETEQTVTISIAQDATGAPLELAETIQLSLGNTTNATVSGGGASITISEDVAQPSFSISGGGSVIEGDAAVLTITRGGDTTVAATVVYEVSGGSADAADFGWRTAWRQCHPLPQVKPRQISLFLSRLMVMQSWLRPSM